LQFFSGGLYLCRNYFCSRNNRRQKKYSKKETNYKNNLRLLFPPLNNPGNLFPGFSSAVLLVHHFVRRQAFHDPDFLPADTASPPAPGLWPGPGPGIAGGHGTGGCAGAMRGVRDRKEKLIERKKGPGISKLCPAYHYPNHRIDGLKGI
jgi:hypothetical protein